MIRSTLMAGLAAAGLMLAACRPDTYSIKCSAENLADGDTVLLVLAQGTAIPIDTAVAFEGKFAFEGHADTTQFGMVLCPKNARLDLPLLIEAGRINVQLDVNPRKTHVGGTPNNNRWQSLMNATTGIGIKIGDLAARIYNGQTLHPTRQALMDSIAKLNRLFAQTLAEHAMKNINNEFGCFVITYYSDFFDSKTLANLIGALPEEASQRNDIKLLQRRQRND